MVPSPMFPKDNHVDFRAVEFFAGVGGFATAWPEVDLAAAIDIHRGAAEVYAANYQHPFWVREIQSIAIDELIALHANLWWMSPPCQPYTLRGQRRDVADPRAQSLLRLIDLIADCKRRQRVQYQSDARRSGAGPDLPAIARGNLR